MFPFWVASDGWAALTRLGSIGLPSQPRLLPSLSSLHASFSGSWVGWAVHGKEVGRPYRSLHFCFLGSWVGWVGRGWAPIHVPSGQRAAPIIGLPSCFLSGLLGGGGPRPRSWVLLGSLHVSFFLGPGSDGWAAAKKLGFDCSSHISFLGSWVGWASRGQEAGLPLGSLHVSFFLGPRSDGWEAAEKLVSFLGSWVGWVVRGQEAGLPLGSFRFPSFWAPGPDGWAAAKKLGSHWAHWRC